MKTKRRPRRLYALLVLVVALLLMLLMLLALSVPVAHPVRCKFDPAEGRRAMREDWRDCVRGSGTR